MADLDKTILKTIEAINNERVELSSTVEFLRNECKRLSEGLEQLDKELEQLSPVIEALEKNLQADKKQLMNSAKKYDNPEELALLREMEEILTNKKKRLEIALGSSILAVQKLDILLSADDTALACLTDLQTVTHKCFEQRQLVEMKRIEAQEGEKQKIAKDMHDGPAQSISNIFLRVELCERLLNGEPTKARKELVNLKQVVRETLQDIRRIIYSIRPMSLDDLGLLPTLQRYIFIFQEESKIPVSFKTKGTHDNIETIISSTVFRIVQEALNNVKKHSAATHVTINLNLHKDQLTLEITDNGKGFDVEPLTLQCESNKGFGIYNMRERVELLSGKFNVTSAVGKGTTLNIGIPLGVSSTTKSNL